MSLGRVFGDTELCRHLLVGVSRGHLAKHFELALRQGDLADVYSDLSCNGRRHVASARMHRADRVQQLGAQRALEEIPGGSGLQCL